MAVFLPDASNLRGLEPVVIGLPLSRGTVRARFGRDAAVLAVNRSAVVVVHGAALVGQQPGHEPPAIPDLGLIEPVHEEARIGMGRDHELDVHFHVAELLGGIDIRGVAAGNHIGVHDAVAGSGHPCEHRGVRSAAPNDGLGDQPFALLVGIDELPSVEVPAVQQRLPSVLGQKRRIAVIASIVQRRNIRAHDQ